MIRAFKSLAGRLGLRSSFWRYHMARALLSLATFAGVILMFPGGDSGYLLHLRVGQVSPRKIVAPMSFRVFKDEDRLEQERRAAIAAVPPVLAVDTSVAEAALRRFGVCQEQVMQLVRAPGLGLSGRVSRLRGLGLKLSEPTLEVLATPRIGSAVMELSGKSLRQAMEQGVLLHADLAVVRGASEVALVGRGPEHRVPATRFLGVEDAVMLARVAGTERWGEGSAASEAVADVTRAFLAADAAVQEAETAFRRDQARETVGLFSGSVLQDEKIVDANERVTGDAYLKLRSLEYFQRQQQPDTGLRASGLWPRVGRALTTLLLLVVFVLYLKLYRPTIYRDTTLLLLLACITLFVLAMAAVSVRVFYLSQYLIPTALLPLIITVLFEHQLALFAGLLLCVLVASVADLGLPFVAVSAVGTLAAVASVANLRRRADFYRAMLGVSVAYGASVMALGLSASGPGQGLLSEALWGVLNGILTTTLAIVVLPLLEHLFNVTTEITLLELTDLNRPLLQRLLIEAPGTHHHSVVVGQLADAAAKAIGARALLSRVGALYHDIGKIPRAEYFRENQGTARSPHDKLAPTMSALILASHVKEGMEMARKHKLPRALLPFIAEHHGTGRMAFFYHKALELDGAADENSFRYPGPKPTSRETAIVMLADGVEAASRSLVSPTPSRIRGVVARILDERAREGQLDDCGLTFRELAQIREAFIPILTAVHHARVTYPTVEAVRRREADAGRDRESLPRDQA